MKVLVACEFSGVVRDAFIRAGHNAVSCDLLETESPGPHYQGDVRDVMAYDWDLLIAHPPCTFLCNSGVKHLYIDGKKENGRYLPRWKDMRKGAEFFKMLNEANIEKIAIENSIMHKYGKAIIGRGQDQLVQPHWFGHEEIKAICWWLKNLPFLVKTNDVGPPPDDPVERRKWARVHQASPGPDRWKERSRFLLGVADAMADQWGKS